MDRSLVIILIIGTLQVSCALFEPSTRDTDGDDEYATYGATRNSVGDAADELGLPRSTKLSGTEQESLAKRSQVLRMEKSLSSTKEREQYFSYRPYMTTDDEKIFFLQLPSAEARDQYAMSKGIYARKSKLSSQMREAVIANDIIMGMPKDAVVQSWGEPEVIEVAGNPLYGNERWKYVEFVSTQEGYQREERIVYFQAGRVAGWERQAPEPDPLRTPASR